MKTLILFFCLTVGLYSFSYGQGGVQLICGINKIYPCDSPGYIVKEGQAVTFAYCAGISDCGGDTHNCNITLALNNGTNSYVLRQYDVSSMWYPVPDTLYCPDISRLANGIVVAPGWYNVVLTLKEGYYTTKNATKTIYIQAKNPPVSINPTNTVTLANDINVYPNPVSQILTIDTNNLADPVTAMKLLNFEGREIALPPLNADQGRINMSTGDLPVGVYFLEYTMGGFKKAKKIEVSH